MKEMVEIWSWNLNLKFEIEDRSLILKLKLHVFEVWIGKIWVKIGVVIWNWKSGN